MNANVAWWMRPSVPRTEPHIRIQEGVARLLTAGDIGLGHHSTDVRQADEAVHVGDGDRLGIANAAGPKT
jgi:hypothetical protein